MVPFDSLVVFAVLLPSQWCDRLAATCINSMHMYVVCGGVRVCVRVCARVLLCLLCV